MSIAGLIPSCLIFFYAPFGVLMNLVFAGVFFLLMGAVTEFIFRKHATQEEKIADLRDRVDNQP
jgi:hypothetical protein